MTSQRNSGSLSKEAEDPYQPQNFSNSPGIGTRQDEDEWLRQHGASGFSGFSGSNNQQEVCILKSSFCLPSGASGTVLILSVSSLRIASLLGKVSNSLNLVNIQPLANIATPMMIWLILMSK